MRKAIVDGILVNLMDDGDDVWTAIRREGPPIKCVGCGGKGHTRELRFGQRTVRIFAHNAGYGEKCRLYGDVGESAQHEVLKESIVRTARSNGWTADIEVVSPDERVRADVVCTRENRTHSWEAQLAGLSRATANQRHGLYVNAWGNTTWVHTRPRDWSRDIPCVRVDDDSQRIVVGGIYSDDDGEDPVPPTNLDVYVPRILNNDGIQYLVEPFGFYRDLGAVQRTRRRTGVARNYLGEGIAYSTTDCPSDTGDADAPILTSAPGTSFGLAPAAMAVAVAEKVDPNALVPGSGMTWGGAARMAAARRDAGTPLNDFDRHVLAVIEGSV